VGGDFYDVFELGGDLLGIVIGDVSGKGLEAAVLTSLLKNTIRAHAVDGDPPAVAIAKTNRLAALQTEYATFATVFFGVLRRDTGRLVYCNAGHPYPLLRHATGEVETIETTSPLVGAFEEFEYEQAELALDPGSVLLLHTDGVTEARCDGELFGSARLEACLAELPADPSAVVQGVLDAVAPEQVYQLVPRPVNVVHLHSMTMKRPASTEAVLAVHAVRLLPHAELRYLLQGRIRFEVVHPDSGYSHNR
jgi:serine phosphatase RsbU (regulator of sigma subunit)